MVRPLVVMLSTALVSLAAPAAPSAHTDFSGHWRMLAEQSDFDKFTRPDIVVRVIEQHDPTLNLHTIETRGTKTTTADISYFLDGSAATNNRGGRNATSKAFWDGPALMIRTDTTDGKGQPVEIVEHWELSPDGQLLITTSDISTAAGGAHLKLVCQKEGAK